MLGMEVPNENGLFVLFDRRDVVDGERDPGYQQFNAQTSGFTAFQTHSLANAVQVYIWPEDANNVTGNPLVPATQEELIAHGKTFGLKALFDCVTKLQGEENWWWEVGRRCRLQNENGEPVPKALACTLEWREGQDAAMGEKAGSQAFEAWFDAVRYQISLNMYKMGIFGSRAENFLHKVRLCYARREPYRYNSVYTEVEGVPVIYLGDSAGSTDFKKGLSCGRGLFCASQVAFDTMGIVSQQLVSARQVDLRSAFRHGGERYQQQWKSAEMVCEWRVDFDATFKYLQAGRMPGMKPQHLQASAFEVLAGKFLEPQLGCVLGA